MIFNSIQFLVFFLIVTVVYFILPHRYRWVHLLLASCIFYCAFIPVYLFVLFFTIVIDYVAGILIDESEGRQRKLYLIISLVSNLGVLAVFKYTDFFIANVNTTLGLLHIPVHPIRYLSIILPIGLSFHTFQAMSYTLEVYRGHQKAERHFGIYSLYVMFFPQLVAGPIERPGNLLPQFRTVKSFDSNRTISGLQQMLWGLFKKVVVADQLAHYVDLVYDHWELQTGMAVVVATWAFAFQIYCDFSGYSDIAQGAASILGFRLMDNFNLPYYASSITEFWRRWHISLSTWLRDYIYIPLGGNRFGQIMTYRNIMITLLLGGLWHGASWNFIIWGFLNGLFLCIEKMLPRSTSASGKNETSVLRMFVTFNLVCFTWIFFRSRSIEQSWSMIGNLFDYRHFFQIKEIGVQLWISFVAFLVMEWVLVKKEKFQQVALLNGWIRPLLLMLGLTFFIVLFGAAEGDQFIYFQF